MRPSLTTFVVATLGALADAIAQRPLPALAAPSPLLAAAGLSRPRLRGGACSISRSPWPRSLRARWREVVDGAPRTCEYRTSHPHADEIVWVTVDGRGRPRHVTRAWHGLDSETVRRSVDSVLAIAHRLPDTRPVACVSSWRPSWAPPELGVIRGWRAPGHVAIVYFDSFSPHDLSPFGWRIDVSEDEGFESCGRSRHTPPRAVHEA